MIEPSSIQSQVRFGYKQSSGTTSGGGHLCINRAQATVCSLLMGRSWYRRFLRRGKISASLW